MQCNNIKNLFCNTESTDYGMEDSSQELSSDAPIQTTTE